MPHDPLLHRLIGALWGAWALYWLATAPGNKPARRRESWRSRLAYSAPVFAGALLIVWRPAPRGGWLAAPLSLAAPLWPGSPLSGWIGLALLAAGLALAVWARVHLGRNWSGTVTVKEGHELIRTGPYARVRHPIYTGLLGAVLGTAVIAGSVRAALGFAIIAAALVIKSRIEERYLCETFPGEYPRYRATVPALLPFTGPRRSAPR
ncbi:MAG TPA: isoprenylcysteine carboxylmethyltransferase family protein [Steroidobacteraceae bacterium]|nr:isoprenylcysteine carboxylmethyltransferase family protein [Steroidobacteraceae bacterium]